MRLYVPDQSREGQKLAEGQRDKADSGRSGWGPAGHQLQELLCLFICGSVEAEQWVYYLEDVNFSEQNQYFKKIVEQMVRGTTSLWPTWGPRCPWGRSTVAAERWPSPHAPLWGRSTLSRAPPPCHCCWARGCSVSAAGWRPAPAAAVCASATAPSCSLSSSGRTGRRTWTWSGFIPNAYTKAPTVIYYIFTIIDKQ